MGTDYTDFIQDYTGVSGAGIVLLFVVLDKALFFRYGMLLAHYRYFSVNLFC